MAAEKALNYLIIQNAESAFRPNEPSIEVRKEAEMRPYGSGPVSLLQQLRDVRFDVRTQRSGIQVFDGFEFSR